MEYIQLQEVSNGYWIADPLWVQLANQSNCHRHTNKVDDVLGCVQEWMQKVTNLVVFCDPLNNMATLSLKTFVDPDVRQICSTPRDHNILSEGRLWLLRNSSYRMLVEEFIQGLPILEVFSYLDFISVFHIWIGS